MLRIDNLSLLFVRILNLLSSYPDDFLCINVVGVGVIIPSEPIL